MIIGDRVQLIPLNEECFDLTLKWINNPEIRRYTGSRFPVSKYEHESWFKAHAEDRYNKTYAIQMRDLKEIIGIVGNRDHDPINRTTAPFIYMGEYAERGHGIALEAMDLFLNFCFNELNVRKIYCYVYEYNQASLRLCEKLGLVCEGVLKQHWFRDGKYHNVLMMGRINEE